MLTREENVFLAKKLLPDTIYRSALIENCNVTYPQTAVILEGGLVNNVKVSDIQIILNLRDAWRHLLMTLDSPISTQYICSINEHVSRNESLAWGVLRSGKVGITGTSWVPPLPNAQNVEAKIQEILQNENALERALEYACYAIKNKLFWGGNTRTALLVANKILIENGLGLLSISPELIPEFQNILTEYYVTDNSVPLKNLLTKSIRTITYE